MPSIPSSDSQSSSTINGVPADQWYAQQYESARSAGYSKGIYMGLLIAALFLGVTIFVFRFRKRI